MDYKEHYAEAKKCFKCEKCVGCLLALAYKKKEHEVEELHQFILTHISNGDIV